MTTIVLGQVFGIAGRRDELIAALLDLQAAVRLEVGCLSYLVASTLEDPATHTIHGHFVDARSLDAHFDSSAFAAYERRLAGLLARPSKVEVFEIASAARPWTGVRWIRATPTDPQASPRGVERHLEVGVRNRAVTGRDRRTASPGTQARAADGPLAHSSRG